MLYSKTKKRQRDVESTGYSLGRGGWSTRGPLRMRTWVGSGERKLWRWVGLLRGRGLGEGERRERRKGREVGGGRLEGGCVAC